MLFRKVTAVYIEDHAKDSVGKVKCLLYSNSSRELEELTP
jgi:hypothetical protein